MRRQILSALRATTHLRVATLAQLLILALVPARLSGAEPITLDETFQFGETNLTTIHDVELFPDGRIAYGGASRFETVGVAGANGEVVNSDSSGWFSTNVLSLSIDPIDRVIYSAGFPWPGEFSAGVQKTLNWDDINWGSLSPVRGRGNKVLQLADRSLLLGGRFQIGGNTNTTYGLVRIDLTGNLTPGFVYEGSEGLEVTDAAIMADDSIFAAFQTTNENGVAYGYHRWESNGTGNGIPFLQQNSRVSAMVRMPGTNLVLLAHEEVNEGVIETSFSWVNEFGTASGPAEEWPKVNGKVHAIAFETMARATAENAGYNRVIIAGEFTRVGTNDCNNLASLNKDGSVAWVFPTNAGPDAAIHDVLVQLDGKVLITGTFTNVSGVEAKGIARIYGSSAEGGTFLYWGDSNYTTWERAGETSLTLKRSGSLAEELVVSLTVDTSPPLASIPQEVVFAPGEETAVIQAGVTDNLARSGKRQTGIIAATTNATVIVTRGGTTLAVLDDEAAGTVDPRYKPALPEFRGTFGIQEDGKIIFGGYGTELHRMNPDGSLDPSFVTNGVPSVGPSSGLVLIQQILPQPDGKIYIAGRFNTTNAASGIHHVARLNADGTLDASFDPRLSQGTGTRWAKILVLDDGDVLVWLGLGLTREGAFGFQGLFRMAPNGQLTSPVIPLGNWSNEPIWEMSDSGDLFTYGDLAASVIRRFIGMSTEILSRIRVQGRLFDMEAQGSSLLLGGNFSLIGTNAVTNIAQLDPVTGIVQTNFNPVVNGTVYTVKAHGGKIYISGDFTQVNGQQRYRVARLHLDGTLDENFIPGFGPNRPATILDLQIDGSVIMGSSFDRVDGIAIAPFARLFGDARPGEIKFVSRKIEVSGTDAFVTVELERVGGSWGQISANVYTLEGSALEGTHFTKTNVTVTYVDGEFGRKAVRIPLTLDAGANGPVTFSIAAESFPNYQEATVLIPRSSARMLATVSATGSTNVFRDIAADANGWVYAVGSFTNVGGVDVTNIVRLNSDLTVDETFRLADLPARVAGGVTNYFTPLNTVAVHDYKIAVGGLFNLVGTNNWASVIRLDTEAKYDEQFNQTVRGSFANTVMDVRHLLYQPDGKLVWSVPGVDTFRFEENGTRDPSFFGDMRHGGEVWFDRSGSFYAFQNSALIASLVRFNTNGFQDGYSLSFRYQLTGSSIPTAIVDTLAIQADDKVLVGGAYIRVGSSPEMPPTPRLTRVLTNRVVDTNFVAVVGTNTPGSGPKNRVTAIQLLDGGNILIGGIFDVVNGDRRTMLALLNTNGELRNDFKVEVVGEQIDQFALLPDGDVIVRGRVSSVDGVEVGNLFKLSIPQMKAPIARFLWPTNGAEVRVRDTQEIIQVNAFDPDGFVEQVVLELDGRAVATNNSGNIPFQLFLPDSGEHRLRMIVTDDFGLNTTETITFQTVTSGLPQTLTISTEGGEVVINYEHGRLLQSTDLEIWTEVDREDGQYRTAITGTQRYYQATGL
jgi:uncharacterized delta-60 repeat protein